MDDAFEDEKISLLSEDDENDSPLSPLPYITNRYTPSFEKEYPKQESIEITADDSY